MNWEALGAIGDLVGAVAVVATLVYLAIQVRQNTRAMQAQTRDSMTTKQMMISGWVATNRPLADAYNLATIGKLQPGTAEVRMYAMLQMGIWREWENSLYQYEEGLFQEGEFAPRRTRWLRSMQSPAARDLWRSTRDEFSPRFRAEIDKIVSEIEPQDKDSGAA